MAEQHSPSDEYNKPTELTIEALLPRYYEVYPRDEYEPIESFNIDGHQVAWMRFRFRGESHQTTCFVCACDFTEHVGWELDEQFGVVKLGDFEARCEARRLAAGRRIDELRGEYMELYGPLLEDGTLVDVIEKIIPDLIERNTREQFIGETTNGAHFWGGHFYLQTVAAIVGRSGLGLDRELWRDIHDAVDRLYRNKKIQLEGMVVQGYKDPLSPEWYEYGAFEYDGGYTVTVQLPSHSKMDAVWRLTVCDKSGTAVAEDVMGPHLRFDSLFGPDEDDIATVMEFARDLIERHRSKKL